MRPSTPAQVANPAPGSARARSPVHDIRPQLRTDTTRRAAASRGRAPARQRASFSLSARISRVGHACFRSSVQRTGSVHHPHASNAVSRLHTGHSCISTGLCNLAGTRTPDTSACNAIPPSMRRTGRTIRGRRSWGRHTTLRPPRSRPPSGLLMTLDDFGGAYCPAQGTNVRVGPDYRSWVLGFLTAGTPDLPRLGRRMYRGATHGAGHDTHRICPPMFTRRACENCGSV